MAQGKYKKALLKKARKGERGYPMATIAFYGPDNKRASKVVCAILKTEDADPEPMRKWFTQSDAMKSEAVSKQVMAFLEENRAVSVAMADSIMGCPHEEGIDYPEGEPCPKCPYWKDRDRFTHELLD